jgi:hypothetical protein
MLRRSCFDAVRYYSRLTFAERLDGFGTGGLEIGKPEF